MPVATEDFKCLKPWFQGSIGVCCRASSTSAYIGWNIEERLGSDPSRGSHDVSPDLMVKVRVKGAKPFFRAWRVAGEAEKHRCGGLVGHRTFTG